MIRRSGGRRPIGPPGALTDPRTRASRRKSTMIRVPSLTTRERFHVAIMARSGLFRRTAIAEAFRVDLTTVRSCEREHRHAPALRPDASVEGRDPGQQPPHPC